MSTPLVNATTRTPVDLLDDAAELGLGSVLEQQPQVARYSEASAGGGRIEVPRGTLLRFSAQGVADGHTAGNAPRWRSETTPPVSEPSLAWPLVAPRHTAGPPGPVVR